MKDKVVKEAMQSDHSMDLPKRDKGKKVWMIIAIIALVALIGLGVYGYMQMQKTNQKIKDQKAQIQKLEDNKKIIEDAARAAAGGATQAIIDSSSNRAIPELGVKYKITKDNINSTYSFESNVSQDGVLKSIGLSITDLILANAKVVGEANNDCVASNGPLGKISLLKAGQLVFDKKVEDSVGANVKKIGDNYFVKVTPQGACTNNEAVQALQTKSTPQVLDSIFNSLQAL